MAVSKLQAWWWARQGLDGSRMGETASAILENTGWARSAGGVNPYLTLWSRGRIGREQADLAVAALEVHELPSARGCTYVVPAADYALALKLAQPFGEPEMNTARKLGVTDAEIDKLCAAVLKALGKQALDPELIKEAVGGAARSLGEAGKKKGLSTTLPLALGRLQVEGEIRRIPVNGRLDQQRYRYVAWPANPLAKCKLSFEECSVELARRYFAWIGPATLAEFQWFSGLGVKAAKAATEPLRLVSVEDRLMLPGQVDDFHRFQPAKEPHYSLVSSLDGLSLLRRDLKSLIGGEDEANPLWTVSDARAGGALQDLPNHAIVDRGRIVGLWEFDPEAKSIAWASFIKKDAAMKKAVLETEAFVREQLEDARSFSLDNPKSRQPKIEALRRAGC